MATRRTSVTLLWMFALAIVTLLSRQMVDAPSDAAGGPFSEARAFDTLTALNPVAEPHPTGSIANLGMRDRIVAALTAAGYTPSIQTAVACGPAERNPGCTAVENIIAVHKGHTAGKAVLATSHYDSTPAGPGISDDGAGVAVMIELARHVANTPTRNDVIFLVTDGEETGLRGAMAFATHHPLMRDVGAVVNVEARGASGPSMMFETGDGNLKLIDLYARAVPRPAANSLTYEIYKLLPNDTDFSVFRRAGVPGFNLAFTGSASLYHSAADSVRTLDRRSMQHQGEQAFALTLALADADLSAIRTPGDAAYFDLFGRWLVRWPSVANVPVAAVTILMMLGLVVRHRTAFTWRSTLWSALALVAAAALTYAIGLGLSYPLGIWPGVHPLDHPAPWAGRIATLASIWMVILPLARLLRGRTDPRVTLLITWILLACVAMGVAITLSGAAYIVLVPCVTFAVAGAIESFARRDSLNWAGGLGAMAFAVFLIGLALALEVTLSFDLTQYKLLALLPLVMTLIPVIAGDRNAAPQSWGLALGVVAVVSVFGAVAARTPAYTPDRPRTLNFTLYDDGEHELTWQAGFAGTPDSEWLASARFSAEPVAFRQFGVIDSRGYLRPSAAGHLPAPTFAINSDVIRDGLRVVEASIHTSRGGAGLAIAIPADSGIRSVVVNNQELLASADRRARPVLLRFWGFVTTSLPVTITFDPAKPATMSIVERGPLPDMHETEALRSARPAAASPAHQGDAAVVSRRIDLESVAGAPTSGPPAR
jgi:hypothetical protein